MKARVIEATNGARIRIVESMRCYAEHVPYPSTFPPELRDGPGFVRSFVEITLRVANPELLRLAERIKARRRLAYWVAMFKLIYGDDFAEGCDDSFVARRAFSGPASMSSPPTVTFDGEHYRDSLTGQHRCHPHLCPGGFRP